MLQRLHAALARWDVSARKRVGQVAGSGPVGNAPQREDARLQRGTDRGVQWLDVVACSGLAQATHGAVGDALCQSACLYSVCLLKSRLQLSERLHYTLKQGSAVPLLRWTDASIKGALDCSWNGDSRPLMRKPGSVLRAPTCLGGFILGSGAEPRGDDLTLRGARAPHLPAFFALLRVLSTLGAKTRESGAPGRRSLFHHGRPASRAT